MRIISVANQKGGCGKTTTSINLSASLAANGRRVLLVDLDPQAHATLGLNVNSQNSLYNVISKITPRKLPLEKIIVSVQDHFDIVPSNVLVGTLEQELSDEIGRELKLTTILSNLNGRYDYIIIDCPPNLGFLTINALRASEEVMIPAEMSRFSLHGVERLVDIIQLVKERLGHPLSYRLLVTMFDSRLKHSFDMINKMRADFPGRLIDTIIHVNVKLKESAVLGQSVGAYDKYCRGAKDYFSLAKEVILGEKRDQEKKEFTPLSNTMRTVVKEKSKDMAVPTQFILKAPSAQSVYVTGEFNNWYVDETCRMRQQDGLWTVQVKLKPGRYQYRFIVDGFWQEDPENPMKIENAFGDANSVVEVNA